MPEADICKAAVDRLRLEGWKVKCEVQGHDAVGLRGEDLLIVEAKLSFTTRLKQQIGCFIAYAHYGLAVVATQPRPETLEWARKFSVAVWVYKGGKWSDLVPFPERRATERVFGRLREKFDLWYDDLPGGVPCLKGSGVTQDLQRRVDEYRATNPTATWKKIFANVPNHYNSAANMYSALRSNAERLAMRERLKTRKAALGAIGRKGGE
jgi:hypothetical protein